MFDFPDAPAVGDVVEVPNPGATSCTYTWDGVKWRAGEWQPVTPPPPPSAPRAPAPNRG